MKGEALIIASWPEFDSAYVDEAAEEQMETLMDLIRGIRMVRAEYNVPPSRRIALSLDGGAWAKILETNRNICSLGLANVDPDQLEYCGAAIGEPPEQAATVTAGGITGYLPLAGLVDLEAEKTRLRKEMDETTAQIARSEELLGNGNFTKRAPENVVQRERDKLADLQAQHATLRERLEGLSN